MFDTAKRVHDYHKQLAEWRILQGLVNHPRFNVYHFPNVHKKYVTLGEFLKREASLLWDQNVNVY